MKHIQENPEKFIFPNYCFQKQFKNYIFLDSGILASGSEPEAYFFRILKALEVYVAKNSSEELVWELLIPNTFEANWSNAKGESGKWEIPKELKCCSLSELQKYFASFPQGYLKSSFIQLADRFWINLSDVLCLYAEYNAEIIVLGIDIDFQLEDLKEMHILPGFETKSIIIGGQPLSVKERELDFFYDSFDEYIDHWGQIFKWDKRQIELLKPVFSK